MGRNKEKNREYRMKNKEKIYVQQKKWREENADYVRRQHREYRAKNIEKVREYHRIYREYNRVHLRKTVRENQRKVRKEVIEHYGGKCSCCGESHYEFLALDHVEGGGRKHLDGICGHIFYWAKKNNYPSSIRVLCHNCNQSRGYYGYCPHEKETKN